MYKLFGFSGSQSKTEKQNKGASGNKNRVSIWSGHFTRNCLTKSTSRPHPPETKQCNEYLSGCNVPNATSKRNAKSSVLKIIKSETKNPFQSTLKQRLSIIEKYNLMLIWALVVLLYLCR